MRCSGDLCVCEGGGAAVVPVRGDGGRVQLVPLRATSHTAALRMRAVPQVSAPRLVHHVAVCRGRGRLGLRRCQFYSRTTVFSELVKVSFMQIRLSFATLSQCLSQALRPDHPVK